MILRIYPSRRRYLFAKTSQSRNKLFPWLVPVLAAVLWMGYKQVESSFVTPQAIFVLGGAEVREKFAAAFARQHPDLHVWVSGGSSEWYTKRIFAKAGIERSRLHLDRRAVDTVENFTTLVDEFHKQGIESVYLITSDYHMRRACVIGEIVLGSRGMIMKPIPVPSKQSPEPLEKTIRDGARAILWVLTGYTAAIHQPLDRPRK